MITRDVRGDHQDRAFTKVQAGNQTVKKTSVVFFLLFPEGDIGLHSIKWYHT